MYTNTKMEIIVMADMQGTATVSEEVQIKGDVVVFGQVYKGRADRRSDMPCAYKWHLKSDCTKGGSDVASMPFEDYKKMILKGLGSEYICPNALFAASR